MSCSDSRERLGRFVDGELPPEQTAEIEAHLVVCPECRAEVDELTLLANSLAAMTRVVVPPDLWGTVERRLEPAQRRRPRSVPRFKLRPRFAAAAAVAFAAGLGFLGWLAREPKASASDLSFAVLLDSVRLDPRAALGRFVARYHGSRTTPAEAARYASTLSFATPDVLPGNFHLQEVYLLRFGTDPGVAARYERNGEFLAAIFHRPVRREEFGSHRDYPCVIGKHRGHMVAVGDWKLVHLTDPSTCHCVLSRLDEEHELPAILRAVAPNMGDPPPSHDHP